MMIVVTLYTGMKMVLYLFDLPPQKNITSGKSRRNTKQMTIEGHSTKYLMSTPQNCQVLSIKNKESLGSCHS